MAKSLDKKRASSKKEDLKKPIKTGREVPKKVLARTVVNSSTNLQELANFITGETQLKKNKVKIAALKREAVEKQKDAIREAVNTGKVFLEPSEEYNPDKILADGGAPEKMVQNIDLYKWEAPIRIQFPFDMKVFLGIVGLCLLFILYLAVLGHYGLMFSIAALLFFLYVAGTTEPIQVSHSITTRGVDTMDKLYEWYMLKSFYFTKKNDTNFLIVETRLRYPSTLIMLIDPKDMTSVFLLLQDKLLYKDVRKYTRFESISFGQFIELEDI